MRPLALALVLFATACGTPHEYRLADGSVGANYPQVNFVCTQQADLMAAQLAAANRPRERIEIHNEVCVSYDCRNMGRERGGGGIFTPEQRAAMQNSIDTTTQVFAQAATQQRHYDLCMQAYGYSLQEIPTE